jgi:hypothetical protein
MPTNPKGFRRAAYPRPEMITTFLELGSNLLPVQFFKISIVGLVKWLKLYSACLPSTRP